MQAPILCSHRGVRAATLVLVPLTWLAGGAAAQRSTAVQSDWQGGPGQPGPSVSWADHFDRADGVSWRAVPGQITLGAKPLAQPLEHVVTGNAEHPASVATGDLDGDGRTDFVVANPVYDVFGKRGAIDWWRNTPTGWQLSRLDGDFYGARYVDTVDFDGDGDLDVLAAAYYGEPYPPSALSAGRNGRYAWFENVAGDGSQWTQHLVGELYWGARFLVAADIDGDGDQDLLGASELTNGVYEQDGDIVWFENVDGNGTSWRSHDIETVYGNAFEAHAADIDGDGDLDVIGTGYGKVDWWENRDGKGGSWLRRNITTALRGACRVAAGDIDGDGDIDVAAAGYNTSGAFWWRNASGNGRTWVGSALSGAIPSCVRLRLGDLDGDNDLDVAFCNVTGNRWAGVGWVENRGNGTAWVLRYAANALGADADVAIGDVDSDGKLDLAVSLEDPYNTQKEQLHWWQPATFAATGVLVSSVLDGGPQPAWGTLMWSGTAPLGTSVAVEVRASCDPAAPGTFTAIAPGKPLASWIDPMARYLQYRLTLCSNGAGTAPVVTELLVSGQDRPALAADRMDVRTAAGGAVAFTLAAGAPRAGRSYALLGSLSGSAPGVMLPGSSAVLPLNPDVFSSVVASQAGSAVFAGFAGRLNAGGGATARLTLPPLPAELTGTTLTWAYLLLDPPDFASNAVDVNLSR